MDFSDNIAGHRFELKMNEPIAFARYHIIDNILFIDYVESPKELRGTGVASQLMHHIMKEATTRGLKIKPICSYALGWFKRHNEYAALAG